MNLESSIFRIYVTLQRAQIGRPESDGLLMCVVIVICISANLYSDIYSLILP